MDLSRSAGRPRLAAVAVLLMVTASCGKPLNSNEISEASAIPDYWPEIAQQRAADPDLEARIPETRPRLQFSGSVLSSSVPVILGFRVSGLGF